METYHILKQLNKYKGKKKAYHIPGHKGRSNFKKRFPVAAIDITELGFSDNLASPSGAIKRAQDDIAHILRAYKSYILTDGSTSGVLSMLYVASKHGKKVIVPRNSHQSVWNACAVLGLEPVILQGEIKHDVLLPPKPSEIENLLRNDTTIAGMIAVSPDYYGNIAPLAQYAEILARYSRLFMVDEAHGAHLAFEENEELYAGTHADIWVDGAHKTLSALTQGAIISVKDEKYAAELEEGLSIFRTTSPSYPIMASVEYGVKRATEPVPKKHGKDAREEFIKRFPEIKVYKNDDWTKLLVDFKPVSVNADLVYKALEKKGVYAELSDGRYILFYLSRETSLGELVSLGRVLKRLVKRKKLKFSYEPRPEVSFAPRSYSFQYAMKSDKELVPLNAASGRMCARNAGIVPPCVPVVAAGEAITPSAVKALISGAHTFGIENGKIMVVKQ